MFRLSREESDMARDFGFATVRERYAQPSEVRKYAGRAEDGLLAWESTVAGKYLVSPGRLLDIGCGGGREAFAFAAQGHSVTAIDISDELLETARTKARALGMCVDFRTCAGTSLDFSDQSFEYVALLSQVLGNVSGQAGRAGLLRDIRRVLQPGGIFIFSAHNRGVCEPIARAKGIVVEPVEFPMEEGDFLLVDDEDRTPCYWHYFTRDEILTLCCDTGFEVLECCLAQDLGQAGWDTIWVCVCRK